MRSSAIPVFTTTSNSGTKTSSALDFGQIYSATFIASFTDAAAAGTLKIQGSNDQTVASNLAQDFTPTTWVDIPSGSQSVASGATTVIEKVQICYRWVRVVWTSSGGAGTFSVNMNVQGF